MLKIYSVIKRCLSGLTLYTLMASGLFFLLERKSCSLPNSQSLASLSHYSPAGVRWIVCLLLTLLLYVNSGMCNTTSKCNPLTLCLDFCEFPWTFSFCLVRNYRQCVWKEGTELLPQCIAPLVLRTNVWLGFECRQFSEPGVKQKERNKAF